MEGAFLEENLPVVAFATLTLPQTTSRLRMDTLFDDWLRLLEAHNRSTIGWVRSYEASPRLHAHATLLAASPIDCGHAERAWQQVAGIKASNAAVVEPFVKGIAGFAYILKMLGRPSFEDVRFSDNLTAFAPNATLDVKDLRPRQRRFLRRIRARVLASWKERSGFCGLQS